LLGGIKREELLMVPYIGQTLEKFLTRYGLLRIS